MVQKVAPLRVVLDINILVSALLFGGRVGMLRHLWKTGRIFPLVSKETFAEFHKVLSYPKFKLSQREIRSLLNDEILPHVEPVEITRQVIGVCRDPHDDMFLAVASCGKARYLRGFKNLGSERVNLITTWNNHYHVVDLHHLPFAGIYRRFRLVCSLSESRPLPVPPAPEPLLQGAGRNLRHCRLLLDRAF